MKEIIDFLTVNKFGNLATCIQDKPDTRPMEMVYYSDKGMFFYTSSGDDLARQLKENPNVCFCSTDANYNYVKIHSCVSFSEDNAEKQSILQKSTFAKSVFNETNLDNMIVFYLPHGQCMMHTHQDNKLITAEF